MKELENAIVASFNNVVDSGKLDEFIQKNIEDTIKGVVKDLFTNWSDFGKNLKSHINEQLNVNLSDLQLTGYNKIVIDQIQNIFDAHIKCAGKEHLENQMKEMLGDPVKEIKLSELMEKFIEEIADDEEYEYGEISFHYDSAYNVLAYIHFDKEADKRMYLCSHTLCIHCDTKKIHSFEINGRKSEDPCTVGRLYGFDKLLFQLYAAGSKVILDHDDVATSYGDC